MLYFLNIENFLTLSLNFLIKKMFPLFLSLFLSLTPPIKYKNKIFFIVGIINK